MAVHTNRHSSGDRGTWWNASATSAPKSQRLSPGGAARSRDNKESTTSRSLGSTIRSPCRTR
eukprot:6042011-Lingulodinium_polyedra.AAC.1